MKRILALVLVSQILLFSACSTTSSDDETESVSGAPNTESVSTHHFDDYIFHSEDFHFTVDSEIISTWVHNDEIFYSYIRIDSSNLFYLVVTGVDTNGKEQSSFEVLLERGAFNTYVNKTGDDEISILRVISNTILYTEHDLSGVELYRQEFNELTSDNTESFHINQCVFTDNGAIVMSGYYNSEPYIFVLDSKTGSFATSRVQYLPHDLFKLKDDRVVAFLNIENNYELREINVNTGDLLDSIPIRIPQMMRMFSAGADSPFDFYISDNMQLIGHKIDSDEKAIILDWTETGFLNLWDNKIGFLSSSRIYLMTCSRNEDGLYDAVLSVLTPVPRETVPELITLTIGGVFISSGGIQQEVIEFNRNSKTHRIEIHDYVDYGNISLDAALLRLRTELITGGGPDIIFYPEPALSDRGFLVDLYTLIDADAELSRSDFFPNALNALEGEDGSLTSVTDSFLITTMIGKTEDVKHISFWDTNELLELAKGIENMPYPLGFWQTKENFAFMMIQNSGNDFIDLHSGKAYLDSDDFIHILEVASRLPERHFDPNADTDVITIDYIPNEYTLINNREQLLMVTNIGNPTDYQTLSAALGEITALGFPTSEGGIHILQPGFEYHIGINSFSKHIDDAWKFVRQILLPSRDVMEWYFPIRIDKLEEVFEDALTPVMKDGKEIPRLEIWHSENAQSPIYAMTQNEANELRAIIETAKPFGRWVSDELRKHMEEDLSAYFAGARTAKDTARIMQNRVQTYLSEQS
ncbi:MAG: ABC transporter substrate-binding protein [Oscillospiraceae bacterium]|nr:ABC transporter substrate-binding protein [Oscillospiraceae bacterium]